MTPSLLHPDDQGRKGALIVFEGIDGSGKSTQAKRLVEWLNGHSIPAMFSFEPTNGPYGLQIRNGLDNGERHDPETELELFRKDRNEHVNNLIVPSLKQGRVVVIDRYYYSSMAYQGSRGLKTAKEIHELMTSFAPTPDLTLVFQLSLDESIRRITQSRKDVLNPMEQRENLRKVAEIFDAMAFPEVRFVDASPSINELTSVVLDVVRPVLEKKGLWH